MQKQPIKKGILLIGCRRHLHHNNYVGAAVVLDNVYQAMIQDSADAFWFEGRKNFALRRQTTSGEGAAQVYDTKTRKWTRMYDFEPLTDTDSDTLIHESSNRINLVLDRVVQENDIPLFLSPNTESKLSAIVLTAELKVRTYFDLADGEASVSYMKERYPLRFDENPFFQKYIRIANTLPIQPMTYIPVEWGEDGFGVLKVSAINASRVHGVLYACNSKEKVSFGLKLRRTSGWTLPGKSFSTTVEVAEVLEVF